MKSVKFTTTGLSLLEKRCISQAFENTEFELEETMTSATSYLLAYKSNFTEKRILAERWSIPVISVQWVYRSLSIKGIKQYRLRKYEGCVFCTSGVTNNLFINYYRLNGAHHSSIMNRYCDFLVVKSADLISDKVLYAKECDIPIIPCEHVFDDQFSLFKRAIQYESFIAEALTDEIFNGKIFYFEGNTPMHQLVRRLVVEHGGNRVDQMGPDVDYSIYFGDPSRKGRNLVWYQWILDSADLNTLLSSDGYAVDQTDLPVLPLSRAVVFPMVCKEESLRTRNKIQALGGEISLQINSKVTHCIVERKSNHLQNKMKACFRMYRINICLMEWLNQCIYYMKKVNESKFEITASLRSLPEVVPAKREAGKKALIQHSSNTLNGWKVQFTGVIDLLRESALSILRVKDVEVIDTREYSPACTHLIVGAVNVSLKLLSAIAAGCILLDCQIIEDLRMNVYTVETDYSLEKRELKIDAPKNEKIVRKLITAAPFWKKKKEETGRLAFSDWCVHVLAEKDKEKIEQLIENGGGVVLKDLSPEEASNKNVLFFVDEKTSVPENIIQSQRIQMKSIILHLAGAKPSSMNIM